MAQPDFADCLIGGTVKRLLTGGQTHVLAAALLSNPKDDVCLTCFTFGEDEPSVPLITALGRAAKCARVQVLADERESLTGKTKRQAHCLFNLVQLGVQVELVKKPGAGQQHSKTMRIGHTLILGSANWTSNSRKSYEMDLCVELDDQGQKWYQTKTKPISGDVDNLKFEAALLDMNTNLSDTKTDHNTKGT